jgi:hypothetical protein
MQRSCGSAQGSAGCLTEATSIDLFRSFDRVLNEFSPSPASPLIPHRRSQLCEVRRQLRYRLRKSPGCYHPLSIQILPLMRYLYSTVSGEKRHSLWRESGKESRFATHGCNAPGSDSPGNGTIPLLDLTDRANIPPTLFQCGESPWCAGCSASPKTGHLT